MIVYREFSSLQKDLGLSIRRLYAISHSIEEHYHKQTLLKSTGEERILHVPSEDLKLVQRKINSVLLAQMEVSPYATAYRFGSGPLINASVHVGQPVLLKLDIRHFFDSIIYPAVKEYAFPAEKYSEPIRVLLSHLCTYKGILPQGAPSSPAISNLILKQFDETVGLWCSRRGINYTRYCDDMTFSGDFNPNPIIAMVKEALKPYSLFINDKKTKVIRNGQKKTVTGYVVNEKLSVSSDYKRSIRQEMHYCMKFGVASHLNHVSSDISPRKYILSLLGRVNFVLTADDHNEEFLGYRAWLVNEAKQMSSEPVEKVCTESAADNNMVRVPNFGKVDISRCPVQLDLACMDDVFLPSEHELANFVHNNFCTFRKSGKNYAVCRGENSLAAVILIVDGVLRANFFQLTKQLICDKNPFWRAVSLDGSRTDVRNGFPMFYTTIIEFFESHKLLYSGLVKDSSSPAAVVIPNYDKLVQGWLPRRCRRDVIRECLGLLAGEKNGLILEYLHNVKLYDMYAHDEYFGEISNYTNGSFSIRQENGKYPKLSLDKVEDYSASADWDSEFNDYFYDYIYMIKEIEEKIDYTRIRADLALSGLFMRSGLKSLIYKMK